MYYIVRNQANKKEKISILHGVSGYFNPGEMAAVMGPSGSGESLQADSLCSVPVLKRDHQPKLEQPVPTVFCFHIGKSTLLDLLAGRKTMGELKGDILFSGVQPTRAFLRRYTGALFFAVAPSTPCLWKIC